MIFKVTYHSLLFSVLFYAHVRHIVLRFANLYYYIDLNNILISHRKKVYEN